MPHEKQPVNWQPLERLAFLATIIDESLDDLETTLGLFQKGKEKPGSLDDALVQRSQRLYSEQLSDLWLWEEQVARWASVAPDAAQRKELQRLSEQLKRQRAILEETLGLLDELKELTIDKILSKDDAQHPPCNLHSGTVSEVRNLTGDNSKCAEVAVAIKSKRRVNESD